MGLVTKIVKLTKDIDKGDEPIDLTAEEVHKKLLIENEDKSKEARFWSGRAQEAEDSFTDLSQAGRQRLCPLHDWTMQGATRSEHVDELDHERRCGCRHEASRESQECATRRGIREHGWLMDG